MPKTGTHHILIVDDHRFILQSLRLILKQLGQEDVETAENGLEAINKITQGERRFAVVFLDLNMPEEDGLVCLRRLSEVAQPPAVVLMSGDDAAVLASADSLASRYGLTLLGVAQKPLTADKIREFLSHLQNAHRTSSHPEAIKIASADIDRGLEQGWFETFFQPQLDIAKGQVVGMEALVRLRHPAFGLIFPDSFIGCAEENGQIDGITDVVIGETLHWINHWRDAGYDLSGSINLSAKTLNDHSFPDRLAVLAQAQGVPPSRIVCELTETLLSANPTVLLDIMARLRLKKFRLSIDDFGTGYASMEQLHGLPFHELKIDKQFVQDSDQNEKSRSILMNSIHLAADMNLSTVAEGVETEANLNLIRELGCEMAQGYLIARPMPADAVLAWLTDAPYTKRDGNDT